MIDLKDKAFSKAAEKIAEKKRISIWWDNKDGKDKQLITTLNFGCKKSYRKLKYQQIKMLYNKWQ